MVLIIYILYNYYGNIIVATSRRLLPILTLSLSTTLLALCFVSSSLCWPFLSSLNFHFDLVVEENSTIVSRPVLADYTAAVKGLKDNTAFQKKLSEVFLLFLSPFPRRCARVSAPPPLTPADPFI